MRLPWQDKAELQACGSCRRSDGFRLWLIGDKAEYILTCRSCEAEVGRFDRDELK